MGCFFLMLTMYMITVVKMGRHRSRLEILASILSVIKKNGSVKKTQIMYQAYLSYKLLIQYLKDVVDADFVFEENNWYRLTPKGEIFLAQLDEFRNAVEQNIKHLNKLKSQKILLENSCPCTKINNGRSNHGNEL